MTAKAPEPTVDKVVRNVSYKLSDEQVIDALIVYFRQRGIHAPDQDRAEYKFWQFNMMGSGGCQLSWEEPA